MVSKLRGHITEHTIEEVKNIIKFQYKQYLLLVNSPQFQQLFLAEYAPHKNQNSVSWAISSGFPSGSCVDKILWVDCLKYGKGHTRPELRNKNIVMHILNSTTHFNADYLKEYYAMNDNFYQNEQLYCYIRFTVRAQKLQLVELCVPDSNGTVVEREILIRLPELILLSA